MSDQKNLLALNKLEINPCPNEKYLKPRFCRDATPPFPTNIHWFVPYTGSMFTSVLWSNQSILWGGGAGLFPKNKLGFQFGLNNIIWSFICEETYFWDESLCIMECEITYCRQIVCVWGGGGLQKSFLWFHPNTNNSLPYIKDRLLLSLRLWVL